MEFKSNEIKAGVIIIISVLVFISFMIAIFGVDFADNTKEYKTHLKYVGGIVRGSLVKYGGMDVGFVSNISLPDTDDDRITVEVTVHGDTPIRVDSEAYVTAIGIMKDQHIEISAGTPESLLLPSGAILNSKEVLSFIQMAEPFGDLSSQLEGLIAGVSDLLNEKNRIHIASIISSVDSFLLDGQVQFLQVVENLEQLTSSLAVMTDDFTALVDSNRGSLDETFTHLKETTEQTTQLIAEMRATLSSLQNMMSSNSTNFVEMMDNFQFASQNLEEFTRTLKERPWLLVRKVAPPERKIP